MVSGSSATQGPATRISRKRTQRIERLERVAARVFAENGYEGTNFELIAAELDLRGPSLYHYFASKEELFLRCIDKSDEDVFARLRRIVDTDLTPVDKLRALFREQVLIVVSDYPEFVPLFYQNKVADARLRDHVLAIRRRHAELFEDVAELIRAAEGHDRESVRVWLETAFGALAYLPQWFDPSGRLSTDQLADLLADTLIAPFTRSH